MVEDNNKQFDKMIEAYSLSILPKKNIKLVLIGDGPQKIKLEKWVIEKKLSENVIFLGFLNNPFQYLRKSMFTLLTSKNEGLPNLITESLACGTPVVAFDCQSGPSELINNRQNGLLVENQDFDKFRIAMNEMVENTTLYQYCKSNAFESVQQFAIEKIGKQWLDYLQIKQN